MKVDGIMMAADLGSTGERARRMEALGYDGLITAETQHNPFLPLTLAAEHTPGPPATDPHGSSSPRWGRR